MSLRVRPARREDVATVYRLVMALAQYERLAHDVTATVEDLETALFGPNPRVFCDLVELDGRPVGMALWFYNFSTFLGRHGLYLEDLYVEPEVRGVGAGKALLKELARRCVDEGLGRLEWSVLDWNQPAIDFYRGLGAVGMDEWTVNRLTGEALARLAND